MPLSGWDTECLPSADQVRIGEAVDRGNPVVLIRIPIKLLADLRKIVARCNGVLCSSSDGNVVLKVRKRGIDLLDLIPRAVLQMLGWSCGR